MSAFITKGLYNHFMLVKRYSLTKALTTGIQSIAVMQRLIKAESAAAILPSDVKFAVFIEAIEKDFNESFVEMDLNPNPMAIGFNMTNEGSVGRFNGYLALTDTKLRFYKAQDLDVTKQNQPANPDQPPQTPGQITLLYETDIAKVTSDYNGGDYVLADGVKKFKLVQGFPIRGNIPFVSKFGGFQGGFQPVFKEINARGGQTKVSNFGSYVTIFLCVATVVLFIYFYFFVK